MRPTVRMYGQRKRYVRGLVTKFITPENWNAYLRQCRGKAKHKTEEFAEQHRLYREKLEGKPFNKYQCPFCTHWHVGHDTRTKIDVNS